MGETIRISCSDCALEHTAACDDCLVSFVCSRDPGDALIIDVAEVRAARLLADVGLVPGLRHAPRAG